MGFMDKAKAKLDQAVDQHGDKITSGIDKAAAAADKKTGGKHAGKIANATGKAKEAMAKRGKGGGTTAGPTPGGTPPGGTPPGGMPPR